MKTLTSLSIRASVILAFLITSSAAFGFYDPAVQRWVNRDPAGQRGGMNLYEFVHNSASLAIDPNGQSPFYIFLSAFFGCAFAQAAWAENAYPGNFALQHCYTACSSARTCGLLTAAQTSALKELIDLIKPGSPGLKDGLADMLSDNVGLGGGVKVFL